ncbi:MAG TPA: DUF72 domain-containing protein [Gammaproteobacteria bacterium]|nr:DUF72 domain-containing protein [Gammaproteobacteria bacterium]
MDRRSSAIHIGTHDWRFPEDTSGFYPPDLPADWQLEYYTTQFHALELPPLTGLPEAATVEEWDAQTLEDAALAVPLTGEWAVRLASGGDLGPLARALAPLGDKLAVMLWPQKPPTAARRFWPSVRHLDASQDPIASIDPDADSPGAPVSYRRLGGTGRHDPAELEALAEHLRARAGQGLESYVFFTAPDDGHALLDAMVLHDKALGDGM